MRFQGLCDDETATNRLSLGWLVLAVASLVFAGLFALLVALARTPVIEEMLPFGRDYINIGLVGHVILAVVIWFLAFQGFLWVAASASELKIRVWSPLLGWLAIGACCAGTVLVAVSALFGLGMAELVNYVPVLHTPVFYAGLLIFALGILLHLFNTGLILVFAVRSGKKLPTVTIGMAAAGLGVFVAFLCFALSAWFQLSTGKAFLDFERLFWGGGHILQAVNTITMVTAWVYLSRIVYKEEPVGPRLAKALYGLYLLFIIPAPVIYLLFDTSSQAHKDSFTMLMQWGLGPSTLVFGVAIATMAVKKGARGWGSAGFSSLVLSVFVFFIGGVIAMTISGVNTKIPAHYHCVIGAVTIAFMGLFYEMAPLLGRDIYSRRLAVLQPYLYSGGILLFAAGLYIAGAHGVARKTYAGSQNLNTLGRLVGMSVMGAGGLVAISGGIAFVYNAVMTLGRGARQPVEARETIVYEPVP
ncbi:MAG: cbb3-type cytochrome c oxidase subunit I [Deltaproteobacteria bacterium]|nr:cbb3-type cytochrome c oxidase subunit I [Deltaproteobacteria bacterium]